MDAREQRGLVIAATARIKRKGTLWAVPAQSVSANRASYTVDPTAQTCTCPDHTEAGHKCKHLFAVQFVIEREYSDDGVVITEKESLTVQTVRKTYRQDWSAYNAAQTSEKAIFQVLLHDLCRSIPEPVPQAVGRPRLPLCDAIFCATFKVYSTVSGRRCISDLCNACEKGFIRRVPHFNSIFNVFDAEETAPVLRSLIAQSAAPLKALETKFAVDSTGFSGCRFDKWFDEKWGEQKSKRSWVKAHAMIGTLTNVVTAVEVLEKASGDGPMLQPLMNATAQQFQIRELSADMAYCSAGNFEAIGAIGADALIPFKSTATGGRGGLYAKAFHYFSLHREAFLERYHARSNIESTFSMIKRKFGDAIRSKTDLAMRNEVLAKFLCHNLCCVIQSMKEFGIDPMFSTSKSLCWK